MDFENATNQGVLDLGALLNALDRDKRFHSLFIDFMSNYQDDQECLNRLDLLIKRKNEELEKLEKL
jgi:hypothetical protein